MAKNVTMEKLGIKHVGFLALGIVLLVIGLFAAFYESKRWSDYYQRWESYSPPQNPYQSVGMLLIAVGVIFSAIGFLYPRKKTEPAKQNTQSTPVRT
jgi:uncharacterized protein YjeT (DUF2065 family)